MTPKTAPRRVTPLGVLLTLLALLALLAGGCSESTAPDQRPTYGGDTSDQDGDDEEIIYTGTNVGMQAPDFTLTDSHLVEHTLSDYRGQTVILYFWASYCPYCLEQNDRMQTWHTQYTPDVVVLSVNLGDSDTVINAYLAENELTYPALMCLGNVQSTYHVYSVPTALVLDPDGIVQFNGHPGYIEDEMIATLAAAQD